MRLEVTIVMLSTAVSLSIHYHMSTLWRPAYSKIAADAGVDVSIGGNTIYLGTITAAGDSLKAGLVKPLPIRPSMTAALLNQWWGMVASWRLEQTQSRLFSNRRHHR